MKIDPKVTSSSEAISSWVIKDELPKCEAAMNDFVSGKGRENEPVSSNCVHNTDFNLNPIIQNAEKDFAEKKDKFILWFIRSQLETARFYMFSRKEDYQAQGRQCDTNDPKKKAFKAVQDKFDKAEAIVKKIEAAKGVVFKGVRNGSTIIYGDVKTGRELSATESNRI